MHTFSFPKSSVTWSCIDTIKSFEKNSHICEHLGFALCPGVPKHLWRTPKQIRYSVSKSSTPMWGWNRGVAVWRAATAPDGPPRTLRPSRTRRSAASPTSTRTRGQCSALKFCYIDTNDTIDQFSGKQPYEKQLYLGEKLSSTSQGELGQIIISDVV